MAFSTSFGQESDNSIIKRVWVICSLVLVIVGRCASFWYHFRSSWVVCFVSDWLWIALDRFRCSSHVVGGVCRWCDVVCVLITEEKTILK